MPKTLEIQELSTLIIAGDERIELPPKVLETPIIPFDQSPINLYVNSFYCCNYTYKSNDCQGYYAIIIKIFEKKSYNKSGDGGI